MTVEFDFQMASAKIGKVQKKKKKVIGLTEIVTQCQ